MLIKIKDYLPTQRRLIQLYSALLYNAHIKGFISGKIYTGAGKYACVPGFNCYSCPGAVGSCPLGALQNALSASHSRAPLYILGILLLYGIIFGRTICGYLCPVGLLQELLHKIPTPKLKKNNVTRILSYFKYVVLVVFVIVIPLWYAVQRLPVPAFCKYICPAGTFEGAIGLLSNSANKVLYSMLGLLFTRKFVILLVTVALCVFIYRAFCRFICPLGAIYSLFAKVNIIGVKLEKSKCIDCGKCISVCGMDIRHVGDHECIHCGECLDSCPTKAISFKAGNIVLRDMEVSEHAGEKSDKVKIGAFLWLVAILFLLVVIFAVN